MDSEILNSIIGAVGIIIGTIGAVIVKTFVENRFLSKVSKNRKGNLQNRWKGQVTQADSDNFEFEMTLQVRRRKISGTGIIRGVPDKLVVLEGGYRNDRFLKMDYHNQNKGIIQFGSFIFELSANNSELNGEFLGFGPNTQKIISGKVSLTKQP